jgi:hypothetical protein
MTKIIIALTFFICSFLMPNKQTEKATGLFATFKPETSSEYITLIRTKK